MKNIEINVVNIFRYRHYYSSDGLLLEPYDCNLLMIVMIFNNVAVTERVADVPCNNHLRILFEQTHISGHAAASPTVTIATATLTLNWNTDYFESV